MTVGFQRFLFNQCVYKILGGRIDCTTAFYLLPCYVLRMGCTLLGFVLKKFVHVCYWSVLCEVKFLPLCLHYTSIAVY